jgi:hypothetical protein
MDLDAELPNILSSKHVKYSLSQRQDAELPSKITDTENTQTCGLCHNKKSEPESLAEQPTTATNSSQYNLPAGLGVHSLRTANFSLPAGLGLCTANLSLPAGLGFRTANFPLPAGLGLHSARTINLPAGLGLRSANSSNLSADFGLRAASQNSNKMFQLIVRYFFTVRFKQQYQSKIQQDLVVFSLLKTISIAKPSAQTNLVNRIFETSDTFNHQWLIVTFIEPNTNIPLSISEGETNKAELDSREQQQNDPIIDVNHPPSLSFQKLQSARNSSLKTNDKFIVVSKFRAPSTTFEANSVKLIDTMTSQ